MKVGRTLLALLLAGLALCAPARAATKANLWIDGDGGACAFSRTPRAYADSKACPSTAAAYAVADRRSPSKSAKVAIRPGSYGAQQIPDSSRRGAAIRFFSAGGGVSLESLEIYGDRTAWRGLTIRDGLSTEGSRGTRMYGATFDRVRAQGAPGINAWWIDNAQDLVFSNGEICCGSATASTPREAVRTGRGDAAHAVRNLTIEGTDIHDWGREGPEVHSECALLLSVQTLVIRNDRFWNCTVFSISLGRLAAEPGALDPSNTLIENNTFEPSDNLTIGDEDGYYAIVLDHVSTRFANLRIRNNSMAEAILFETADVPDDTGFDQTVVESNIIHGLLACAPDGMTPPTFRSNVLDGARCGSDARMVRDTNDLYTAPDPDGSRRWDFRLRRGSAAAGAASGVSGQSTRTDIDGRRRDAHPDAGAYESRH